MPFDLKKKDTAERFYYPNYAEAMKQPEAKREWVEFKAPSAEFLKILNDQTREVKIEYVQPRKANGKIDKRAVLQRMELSVWKKEGEDLFNRLYWDHVISGWQIFEPDGKPIPCTPENKLTMLEVSEFDLWAGVCIKTMTEQREKRIEDLEKNLLNSASESQKGHAAKTA